MLRFRFSFQVFCCGLMLTGLLVTSVEGRFRRPDLENVPVKTLTETLMKKVKEDPDNAALRMNLGRAYAMAYSQKTEKVQVNKQSPEEVWFGYTPQHVPFNYVTPAKDKEATVEAKENLAAAIKEFEAAVKLDKDNLTARLSLAWCLEQSGKKEKAKDYYREIVAAAWKNEKDMQRGGLRWKSVVAEAAQYLKPMLDKDMEAKELADLDEKVKHVSKIMRPITPVAIPLKNGMELADMVDRNASVKFDADGSGYRNDWSWISTDAAWLVYDKKGNGRIDSGLQLFGNVTFWCFWDNGYQAMGCLDSNLDGKLNGPELKHLGLWQDSNQNGISDPGEVRPLSEFNIVELDCQFQDLVDKKVDREKVDAVAFSSAGVKFSDGSTRATYDVLLHRR